MQVIINVNAVISMPHQISVHLLLLIVIINSKHCYLSKRR